MKQETASTLSKFKELQEKAQEQRDERIRLQGVIDNIKSTLKARGYNSIEEARSAVTKFYTKRDALEIQFNKLMNEFQKKYAQYL